jgi:hypothetical protein
MAQGFKAISQNSFANQNTEPVLLSWRVHFGDIPWKIFVDTSRAVCVVTFQLSLHKANNFLGDPQSNLLCHIIHKPKGVIYQARPEPPKPHVQKAASWVRRSTDVGSDTCMCAEPTWSLISHVSLGKSLNRNQVFICHVRTIMQGGSLKVVGAGETEGPHTTARRN